MIKKIGKHRVDVARRECSDKLSCYWLGFDKGTYVVGRGYTNYHEKELPVCWNRHMNGCPKAGVCEECKTIYSPAIAITGICDRCKKPLPEVEDGK